MNAVTEGNMIANAEGEDVTRGESSAKAAIHLSDPAEEDERKQLHTPLTITQVPRLTDVVPLSPPR